jgi:hypothetical protein
VVPSATQSTPISTAFQGCFSAHLATTQTKENIASDSYNFFSLGFPFLNISRKNIWLEPPAAEPGHSHLF